MVTDGTVEPGRFSGGRSNFSQMCTLLSQYLKENGSFGDLKLGFTRSTLEPQSSPAQTMNLLPMIEESGQVLGSGPGSLNKPPTFSHQQTAAGNDEAQKKANPCAQMTIFYAGQVIVFDDFPADKVQEIMTLASKSSAVQNRPNTAFPPLRPAQIPAESTSSAPTLGVHERRLQYSAQPPLSSDLPIARKISLARFLEKRKDRITANAPYQPSSKASNKAEAWLELAH